MNHAQGRSRHDGIVTGITDTCDYVHTEKYFRNLIKSQRNQIVFIIFWLISNQTDVRLDPNQSKNGKYNLILVWINKVPKSFLCVQQNFRQLMNRLINDISPSGGLRWKLHIVEYRQWKLLRHWFVSSKKLFMTGSLRFQTAPDQHVGSSYHILLRAR